jgi:hypothetical protein
MYLRMMGICAESNCYFSIIRSPSTTRSHGVVYVIPWKKVITIRLILACCDVSRVCLGGDKLKVVSPMLHLIEIIDATAIDKSELIYKCTLENVFPNVHCYICS